MAPVVPIVASAAVASGGAALVGASITGAFTSTLLLGGLNLAVGTISNALSGKASQFSFSAEGNNRTIQLRDSSVEWRVIYGEARVAGAIRLWEVTDNNKYHHLVVVLAAHTSQEIGTVYFNGEPIHSDMLDGSGNVTSGKYNGKARIKKHLGATDQAADSDLLNDISIVDSNFRFRNHTYIYVRIEADTEVFPTGLPLIEAEIKGVKVYDTRTAGTLWSPNPALCLREYLINTRYGPMPAFSSSRINDTYTSSEANICDEFVTTKSVAHDVTSVSTASDYLALEGDVLEFQTGDRVQVTTTATLPTGISASTNYYVICRHREAGEAGEVQVQLASSYANALAGTAISITAAGSGTHTVTKNAEPRYTCNGVLYINKEWSDSVRQLLSAMGGTLSDIGTKWVMLAAAYRSPTISYDETDLRGKISLQTEKPRNERFNTVRGQYVSPINLGQVDDYPVVSVSSYVTADGEEKTKDLDLPFTSRSATAQRLARIAIEKNRRKFTISVPVKITGLQSQVGDVIEFSNTRYSWTDKTFEIGDLKFLSYEDSDGVPTWGVDFTFHETDSDVYGFTASTDETVATPAAVSAADSASVIAPTNLSVQSGTAYLYKKKDGTVITRLYVSWDASVDYYVRKYEVQMKRSADSDWEPATDPGDQTFIYVFDVEDGDNYDVRVRAVNRLGIRSSWVTVNNHTVIGKTDPPSNVSGFSAQQNGNVVTFRWMQVSDTDLSGYEIRYAPQGSLVWADANALTKATKGTLVTNAGLPPGSHTVGIKAVDTSGNYSITATTYDINVVNENDIIDITVEHARWTGALSNMIIHNVSGRLVPKSQDSDSSANTWDVFDSFVPNPVTSCSYESNEIDLGFAAQVRIYADPITLGLGPEETGLTSYNLEVAYGASPNPTNWTDWTVGEVTARYIKYRLTFNTSNNISYLDKFSGVADTVERIEKTGEVTISPAGTTITYADYDIAQFHNIPSIQVTAKGSSGLYATYNNVTTTSVDIYIFNTAGSDVGGTASITITGV